jgi:phasin family protein
VSAQSKPALPTVDVQALVAIHGRNVEALTEAGRIMGAGVEAIARRQAEIAQAGLKTVLAEVETVLKAGPKVDPKAIVSPAKAREAYAGAVAQTEELVEMGSKAAREAYEVLKARSIAQIDEIGKLAA